MASCVFCGMNLLTIPLDLAHVYLANPYVNSVFNFFLYLDITIFTFFGRKIGLLRMNQRHPQSRHTPHGGSEKTDTEKGTRARKRKIFPGVVLYIRPRSSPSLGPALFS